MKSFSIDKEMESIYSHFPENSRKPVIGITANFSDGKAMIMSPYYEQVERAGGIPVLLAPTDDAEVMADMLDHIDGLLLSGGADYNPLWAGEEPNRRLGGINVHRDRFELMLTRLAFNRQIPMLGICRGIQTLAVALGGKVAQDIGEWMKDNGMGMPLKHSEDAERTEPTHTVGYVTGSILDQIYAPNDSRQLYVNSFHHQAVSEAGPHLRVIAKAPDGVVEAVESSERKSILGIQWHPEWLGADGLPVFKWLTAESRVFAEAKQIHHSILTLDSHCDTPMFFPQGVDFMKRDPRILYDIHKMTEGRTDAVTMVAYLPQPKQGQRFSDTIDLAGIELHSGNVLAKHPRLTHDADGKPSITPFDYANLIFDKIEDLVANNSRYLALAANEQQLRAAKAAGKKSVFLGIENGLALEGNPDNVAYFAQRGIVYITLCHNGDNDICDSARGSSTHGGVSPLGAKVISAMNDAGLMVDLSHAAERSFYDALEISRTPIVCSHSNCKALCDVPRNLTDDQLRALAKAGGVAQITLYHGFLRKESEADIYDALAHLAHAIEVMGIDHVGIGTDFDGDGGIRGLADASELINFTTHLLKKKYTLDDITKIWGGNWLRVMKQVQSAKK